MMIEEQIDAVEETEAVEEVVVEEPSYTEIELEAMEMGWKPQDQIADDIPFVDAEEYVARKPLYDGLRSLNKKIKRQDSVIDELTKLNKKIEEATYERAIQELTEEKRLAYASGDIDEVMQIDEKIREQENSRTPADEYPPEYYTWVEDNDWYVSDAELKAYADMVGTGMRQVNPDMTTQQFFDKVAIEVKARFPEKFSKALPNRGIAPNKAATSSGRGAGISRRLTQEQRTVGHNFVNQGVFKNLEEYAKRLEVAGDLGS
jgi:hypothetical protein